MQASAEEHPGTCDLAARHRFAVAPMMDCTDRHYRYLARLISRRALLYTPMLTSGAVIFGDASRLLDFDAAEHPLVLQLGGGDPVEMGRCARVAERWDYDEINVNVGCPSGRVQAGTFGACLMKRPDVVADCVRAMHDASGLPVTVKHRIGVDDLDSSDDLKHFVDIVARGGCSTFIIHARKAWLQGLSPKENREIPPLCYPMVHDVKRAFPELTIVINGGFDDIETARQQLDRVDGVMLGRAAYANPFMLAPVDELFFGAPTAPPTRTDVLTAYLDYCASQLAGGVPLQHLTRRIVGLFQGCRGARAWRRCLSENARLPDAGLEVIEHAASLVPVPV